MAASILLVDRPDGAPNSFIPSDLPSLPLDKTEEGTMQRKPPFPGTEDDREP